MEVQESIAEATMEATTENLSFEQQLVNRMNEQRNQVAQETVVEGTEQLQEPVVVVETEPVVEAVQEPVVEAVQTEEKQNPFYNEQIEKLNEMVKNGIPLTAKTFEYQSLDFDGIDLSDIGNAIDILERELADVQNHSADEVEFIMQETYPSLYRDIDEDDEAEVAQRQRDIMKAKINAKGVVGKLKEYQSKILLPQAKSTVSNEPTPEQVAAQKAAFAAYQQEAQQAVNSFKTFEFSVADGLALKIDVDEKSVGYAKELALNPQKQNTYFPDRYVKDGKRDIARMVRDLYILDNFDAIMKEALHQQQAIGEEKILKAEGISPTLKNKGASTASTVKTPLQQWKEAQNRNMY